MKYYLDTNAVRELISSYLLVDDSHEFITSELVIGELISGIVSEDEYVKRKNILKKIVDKNLSIIWESPRTLFIKSFDLYLEDTDVQATQIMMKKIIESKSYDELKNLSFYVENSLAYTLEIFIDFDNRINKDIQNIINEAIKIPSKEDKKKMRDEDYNNLPFLIHSQMEVVIRNILLNYYSTETTSNVAYQNSCDFYFQNRKLETYFKALILSNNVNIANSRNAGKNDGFDYWNLVYSSYADYFVSNDKIYKILKKYEDNFFDMKFIDLDELRLLELNKKAKYE